MLYSLFEDSNNEPPVVGSPEEKFIYELIEHGREEFEHFQEIWDFASRRGCVDMLQVTFDMDVINMKFDDLKEAARRKHLENVKQHLEIVREETDENNNQS